MNKQLLPNELIQYILKIKTFTRNQRIDKIHAILHLTIIPIDVETIRFGIAYRHVYFYRRRSLVATFEVLFDETIMRVRLTQGYRTICLPSISLAHKVYSVPLDRWVYLNPAY